MLSVRLTAPSATLTLCAALATACEEREPATPPEPPTHAAAPEPAAAVEPEPAAAPTPAVSTQPVAESPTPSAQVRLGANPPGAGTLRACASDDDCTSEYRTIKSNGACCITCARPYSKAGLATLTSYCARAPDGPCSGQPRCRQPGAPRCLDGQCALAD